MRNASGRAIVSRRLALERLESRDVPASLVEVVYLPEAAAFVGPVDAVDDSTNAILYAGDEMWLGKLSRIDDQGRLLETIQLTPLAGHADAGIFELSEDGRWAIGYSHHATIFNPASPPPVALTLWRLSEPNSPIALDFVDFESLEPHTIFELSELGRFTVSAKDGRLLLISSAGVEELTVPPGTDLANPSRSFVFDASRKGHVLVGTTVTGPPEGPAGLVWSYFNRRATVWRSNVSSLLVVEPGSTFSTATSVSEDGRIIGGSVGHETRGPIAAVWEDGQLQLLRTKSGDLYEGEVNFVVNGLGGDPHRWLAFGTSLIGGYPASTFVARADGVAVSLTEWLQTDYGFNGTLNEGQLMDVLLADNRLRLFSGRFGDPVSPLSAGMQTDLMVPHFSQLITINLASQFSEETSLQHDVNDDQRVNPLDVLAVVNALHLSGPGMLVSSLSTDRRAADVDADGVLTLLDLLAVVNYLTLHQVHFEPTPTLSEDAAEGESDTDVSAPNQAVMAVVIDQICDDLATRRRRR